MSDSNDTNATLQDLLTEYDVGTGITRPLSERGKPMPDQSHLYIDVTIPSADSDLFAQEEVKVNAPTIASSATLVKFSRSIPEFVRKDKRGAARNDAVTGSKDGVHRGTKKILDCPEHDALVQCGRDFYQYTKKQTAQWEHGEDILPSVRYRDFYAEDMRVIGGEARTGIFYTELLPAFLDAYPAAVRQAHIDMGSSHDESLYPTVEQLERTIKMSVVYKPVAGVDDFRLDIPAKAQEEIKARYQQVMDKNMQQMGVKIWERLLKPLKNMSEKLDYDNEGKPRNGHFQTTIVDNVVQIVDLMKDCNFNNDPEMARVQRALRNALTGVSADTLKASPTQRIKTKEEVDRIIKSLPSFGI